MSQKRSKLTDIRSVEGWSLAVVARHAGVSAVTVKKFERGGKVRPETVGKIVKGLNNIPGATKQYSDSDIR